MKKEWIEEGKNLILNHEKTLVVFQNGEVVFTGENRGVQDLLHLYQTKPELLKDAVIIDKVIGKAVAVLAVLGQASFAYGLTMSESAITFFENKDLAFDYEEKTPYIINRMKNGMCPIESSVYDLEDEKIALAAMMTRLKELKEGK